MRITGKQVENVSETDDPDAMRSVRRARRRLVRSKLFLTADQFCRHAAISQGELRTRLMHGSMFAIRVGRERLYPAFFVRNDRLGLRLARVCRAMSRMNDAWGAYLELTYRFESLDNRSLLQVISRAAGFRAAMRYARALAGDSPRRLLP